MALILPSTSACQLYSLLHQGSVGGEVGDAKASPLLVAQPFTQREHKPLRKTDEICQCSIAAGGGTEHFISKLQDMRVSLLVVALFLCVPHASPTS